MITGFKPSATNTLELTRIAVKLQSFSAIFPMCLDQNWIDNCKNI
ncbi:hypothetical protein SynBIOSE41_01512 [Synechococcus sp. BIOS-E4-1]|nr:hypothetical protein SynBIOSE41_01512 [Synechococcus sp. BIOS-E4-1]